MIYRLIERRERRCRREVQSMLAELIYRLMERRERRCRRVVQSVLAALIYGPNCC